MKPFKKQLKRVGNMALGGKRLSILAPLAAGVTGAALLMNLGLTQFQVRGNLAEDGFAVPQSGLSQLLQEGESGEAVSLVKVNMGDPVFVRVVGSKDYYVGETKTAISSAYPLYTRDSQVLYFLDDSLNLVTDEWETLSTYEGLYLSDGVTYNADNTQADLDRVMLVQVGDGYQVARETVTTSALRDKTIPMNAVCDFTMTGIGYSVPQEGRMTGGWVSMSEGSRITIGEDSYDYRDFLERLGLWEEEQTKDPDPTPSPEASEEVPESESPKPTPQPPEPPKPAESSAVTSSPAPAPSALPAEPGQPAQRPKPTPRPSTGGDVEPKPPAESSETPAPPKDNPNPKPAPPGKPAPPADTNNQDWKEPTVSFEKLTSWVYTLSSQGTVSDPAQVLKNGVQIYVYRVVSSRRVNLMGSS